MAILTGQDKLNEALHQGPCDTKWSLRVNDPCNGEKLDAIVSALGGSVDVSASVSNVAVANADEEVSFNLPANCKGFILKSRKVARLKFSYSTGVLTNYLSIPLGGFFQDTNKYSSQTIYFSSGVADNVIEIVTYF